MMRMKFLICFTLLLALFACAKKKEVVVEKKLSYEELQSHLSHLKDGSTDKNIPQIDYLSYGTGVVNGTGKIFIHQGIYFYLVEFDTESHAKDEAKRLNQYFLKNWLLDRVNLEPALEEFVETELKATHPNRPPKEWGHHKNEHSEEAHPSGHTPAAH